MKRDSDPLMRLIAFALLLNAALLGVRCSSSSDLSVLEADSPELLARFDPAPFHVPPEGGTRDPQDA